jgi:peptidoglycan/xylan/chitin deacetylase (PgdA/CDA1 family)
LLVFNYHRIGRPGDSLFDWDLWSADEAGFDWQVQFLKQNFDIVGPADLADVMRRGRGRYVMLTFDDGYRDNYDAAFQILKAHDVTATFFLATGFLDDPRVSWWDEIAWMVRSSTRNSIAPNAWFDELISWHWDAVPAVRRLLKIYKQLPGEQTAAYLDFLADATGSGRCPAAAGAGLWMTWDMVREMHGAGMSFGAHTVNHPLLGQQPREVQDFEIRESRRRIEQEIGRKVAIFSYPIGKGQAVNDDTLDCLREQGFEWAFRYENGYYSFDTHQPYNIPRVAVESDMSRADFRAKATLPQVFG